MQRKIKSKGSFIDTSWLDLLKTAESALIELAALATRLREIGIADTNSSNRCIRYCST